MKKKKNTIIRRKRAKRILIWVINQSKMHRKKYEKEKLLQIEKSLP